MATMILCYNPRKCGVTQHQVGTKAALTCNPEDNERFKHGSKGGGKAKPEGWRLAPKAADASAEAQGQDPTVRRMSESIQEVLDDGYSDGFSIATNLIDEQGMWDNNASHSIRPSQETQRLSSLLDERWPDGSLNDEEPAKIAEFIKEQGWESPRPLLPRTGERPPAERISEMGDALSQDPEMRGIMTNITGPLSPDSLDRMERAIQDFAVRNGFEDAAPWAEDAIAEQHGKGIVERWEGMGGKKKTVTNSKSR